MNVDDYEEKDLLPSARVAESAERFDDMCNLLQKLVEIKCEKSTPLTTDERNLLSVAFKNVVGTKRQSWRTLTAGGFDDLKEKILERYKAIIEGELEEVCRRVIKLLEKATAVAKSSDNADEDVVFYLKMSGDYYRYLSEFRADNENRNQAEQFYKDATERAKETLPETHPTRLGLALNYSVCCYEILSKKDDACRIAKEAFDSAIEKLDTLNDSSYKDSTLIMQLLRDNLTLWTSETEKEQPTQDTPEQ